jgi:hypothetical protein
MKAINKYRKTSQYCLNGSDVQDMAKILAFFDGKGSIDAIGKNAEDHGDWDYTVRVSTREELVDHIVHVSPSHGVSITKSVVVLNWARAREIGTIAA